MTQGQFFKRSLTGFNSEFSVSQTSCLTKAEEPSLSCYLPIAGGRIIGFIPFPRVFVLCEMQSVSSRIWTRVAVSISYDDNHYTTGTSIFYVIIPDVSIMVRVFANDWGDLGSIPGRIIPKTLRIIRYGSRVKCCNPEKTDCALPYTLMQ